MILWDIIEEHLDEAAFLWSQWERALVSPAYTLREVMQGVEERLRANLDGLVQGGPQVADQLLLPALDEEDPHRVCAATLGLLSDGTPNHVDEIIKRMVAGQAAQRTRLARVLTLCRSEALTARLLGLLRADVPAPVLVEVLDILGTWQVDAGASLEPLLRSEQPELRASALWAAARMQRKLERNILRRALEVPEPGVQQVALKAGLLHGHREAWEACEKLVMAPTPPDRELLLLASVGTHPKQLPKLLDMLGTPTRRANAIWALGFSGQLSAAEACVDCMHDEQVARLAGEAFCAITGLVLEGDFVGDAPEEEQDEPIPLDEEDLDASLLPKPEEALALPEPDRVKDWWKQARARFTPGIRYLSGRPLDARTLQEMLVQAPMRRRPGLALELAIRSHGEYLLQTQGFTREQWEHLTRLRLQGIPHLTRPFSDWMTL